jgi:hypothetical protein
LDRVLLGLSATALLAYAGFAFAYRPFDSTDADVAKAGELEVELGPVQWLRENGKRFLQVPAVIANFGLERDRELVIEGRHEVALDPEPDEQHSALVDNAVSIKQVLRRGVLQDGAGPSIATEYGILLPDVHGVHGTGASLAGIVSQRGDAGTVHLNGVLSYTREHEPGLFLGVILEGPYSWPVRPVAEVFTDRARGSTRVNSGLVGAIWRVRDGLSFDVGVRSAKAGDEQTHEVRLGLTWAFAFKKEP